MRPNDPYLARQWHFGLMGDIGAIWDDYTGAGVHVGVYDTGVDLSHPDLVANLDSSRNVVTGGVTRNGTATGSHGTAVAGLISASGNNGIGVVGVAYGSSFTSVDIFGANAGADVNADNLTNFLSAVHQAARFDVINNSWGADPSYASFQSFNVGSFTSQLMTEHSFISAAGRDGLGTVVVKSAGNEDLDVNGDGDNVSRYSITVSAILQSGYSSEYSNYGSSVLVAAAGSATGGSIVTTDRGGSSGYNGGGAGDGFDGSGNYGGTFNGTSAAAPLVSGVVTLMLDANSALGWRDVQNILALTADHTGSAIGATTWGANENDLWKVTGADNWNGGGGHFHSNYGYGAINAFNAVRMAEAWTYFSKLPQTSANEQSASTGTVPVNQQIAANGTTTYTFAVGSDLVIEHVDLTLDLTASNFMNLRLFLTSPDGTLNQLYDGRSGSTSTASAGFTWTYGLDGLRGELTAGTWTITVTDVNAADTGTLNSAKLVAYGSGVDADDVYHYTDELHEMLALDAARGVLADTDGGRDWIDAATLHLASTVDLSAGTATIDGVLVTVSGIENIIGGDGNDAFTGDGGVNVLVGMRGEDALTGGDGDDILEGGRGADFLDGGAGSDTISYEHATSGVTVNIDASHLNTGEASGDQYSNVETIKGSAFGDSLTGAAENNIIDGGGGDDSLYGGLGDDILIGGKGGDRLDGGSGIDTISYRDASAGVVVDISQSARNTGDAAGDSYIDVENIVGSAFNDDLTGAAEDNVLEGGAGADRFAGGGGVDFVSYAEATSRVVIDFAEGRGSLGDAEGDTFATDILNAIGSDFDDWIGGSAGATNILDGGLGNDTYLVNDILDVVIEASLAGLDQILSTVSYVLAVGAEIEELRTTDDHATTKLSLKGNDLANRIVGNAGSNTLDGGAGIDVLIGFGGDDTYIIDSIFDFADESVGGGADTIKSSVSYALVVGQSVENLRTTDDAGTVAINLTGNEIANKVAGNAAANVLDGGAGIDSLAGYGGNDTYIVDNAKDLVNEQAGRGTDTVKAGVSYILGSGASVEMLRTTNDAGTAAINLTGNALDNKIAGNAGANILDGGSGGADVLAGYGGNDKYYVNGADDVVHESASKGTDIVYSSASWTLLAGSAVEEIRTTRDSGLSSINLTGNDLANRIAGNAGVNILTGKGGDDTLASYGGNDRLIGGLGADTLYGGGGNDVFVFTSVADSGITASTRDRIQDFTTGDRIDVSAIDANASAGGNQAFVLDTNASFSTGEIRQTSSGSSMLLEFNTDSDAAAEFSVLVVNHGLFGSGDFVL